MNKKTKVALGGLSVSAVVAGVALTGGTSAYFYDLERSEDNSASACSLDLVENSAAVRQIGWAEDDPATGAVEEQSQAGKSKVATASGLTQISLSKLQPGDAFEVVLRLNNEGTCAGELWGDINFPLTDTEGDLNEPEADLGDDANEGELDDAMEMTYNDNAGNSFTGSYNDLAYAVPQMMSGDLGAGSQYVATVTMTVPDSGVPGDGNIFMDDAFSFAVDFALAQKNQFPGGDLNITQP